MTSYYEKNREKVLEYQKEYNKNHYYKISDYNSNYWKENKYQLLLKRKQYEANNYLRLYEMRNKWYLKKKEDEYFSIHSSTVKRTGPKKPNYLRQSLTKSDSPIKIVENVIVRFD